MNPQQILDGLRASNLGNDFTHFMVFHDNGPWNPICFRAKDDRDALGLAETFNGYRWELFAASNPPRFVFKN